MIRNAEVQFDNRNVELLTGNYTAGIEAYKRLHRIKDDASDYAIYVPYKKTNELVGQIQNLKKVPTAGGVSEKRISKRIQRDSWSAVKYGLRLAQILERTFLVKERYTSDWDDVLKQYDDSNTDTPNDNSIGQPINSRIPIKRTGGRIQ